MCMGLKELSGWADRRHRLLDPVEHFIIHSDHSTTSRISPVVHPNYTISQVQSYPFATIYVSIVTFSGADKSSSGLVKGVGNNIYIRTKLSNSFNLFI